jgi:hypothetical protein
VTARIKSDSLISFSRVGFFQRKAEQNQTWILVGVSLPSIFLSAAESELDQNVSRSAALNFLSRFICHSRLMAALRVLQRSK